MTYDEAIDDGAVYEFSFAMKSKLAESRAKGRSGWQGPGRDDEELITDLLEHLEKGNSGTFVDIANYAMMLHIRGADPTALAHAAKVWRTE